MFTFQQDQKIRKIETFTTFSTVQLKQNYRKKALINSVHMAWLFLQQRLQEKNKH